MDIGSRLKKLRKAKKITQQQLADAIGKSKSTVEKYEANKVENIPLSTLEDIAYALECDVNELYNPLGAVKKINNELTNLLETVKKNLSSSDNEYYKFIYTSKEINLLLKRINVKLDSYIDDIKDANNYTVKVKITDNKDNYTKILSIKEAEMFFKEIDFIMQTAVDRLKYFDNISDKEGDSNS